MGSLVEKTTAKGLWIKGFRANQVEICFSKSLLESVAHEQVLDCFRCIQDSHPKHLAAIKELEDIKTGFRQYREERGAKSRPIVKYAVLALDETDQRETQLAMGDEYAGLVRTVSEFAFEKCHFDDDRPLINF